MMGLELSFEEFQSRYSSEEECIQYMFQLKWPGGYACPSCGNRDATVIRSRRLPLYQCRRCRSQASLTVDTVMQKSKTPLRKWFFAIYWIARGASATQIAEIIKVTYKTAWLIGHKIRHALKLAEDEELLKGRVCAQEDRYRATSFSGSFNQSAEGQALLAAASLSADEAPLRIKLHQLPASSFPLGGISKAEFRDFATTYIESGHEPQKVNGRCSSARNRALSRVCREAFIWLNETFCGIRPKHLQAYLDQFVYRFRLGGDYESLILDLFQQCVRRPVLTYRALVRRNFTIRKALPRSSLTSQERRRAIQFQALG